MQILHYCQAFSPLSETFIYDVIVEQAKLNLDVQVLTHAHLNPRDRPFTHVMRVPMPARWHPLRLVARGLEHFGLGEGVGAHNDTRALLSYWPLLRSSLERALEHCQPEIIHAHFGTMGVLISPIVHKLRIPLVVSFHGFDAFKLPRQPFWRDNLRLLFNQATAITVVSNIMREQLLRLGCPTERLHLIHVGKRPDDYPFYFPPTYPIRRWISVGRFTEKKGFSDCLLAFRRLVNQDKTQSLTIIGDGPQRPMLQEMLIQFKLQNHVQLLGSLPHDKVKAHLASADAFILCSKTVSDGDQEGIPTVLMEAQAMGLPCVSTLHSGIPEVFPQENQKFLAKEGDIEGIARCMMNLLDSSPLEIANFVKNGRTYILQHFNLTEEVQKIIKLYKTSA